MNYEISKYIEWLSRPESLLVVSLLLILFMAWINRRRLQVGWQAWKTSRLLNSIGVKQLYNLTCPDGLDGEYVLERLALLPDRILLISYKRYPGNIYCAEKISEWTQVLAQKSFKFNNPLFELDNQLTALQELIPGVPVSGVIFFDQNTFFPKGYPDRVLHAGNIPESFVRENCSATGNAVEAAWKSLNRLAEESTPQQQLRLKT